MKRSRVLLGAVLLIGVLCGCNTDQPTTQGRQLFQVNLVAAGFIDCFYDVWDRYLDLNINNQVDVGIDRKLSPSCGENCVGLAGIVALPVPLTVRISVVRAGTAVREDLTSLGALGSYSSYTDQPPIVGDTPPRTPESCGDVPGTCVFDNPRRLPYTNVDAQNCAAPADAQLPPPNIAGQPFPFTIEVGPGDVVIVEARAQSSPFGPFTFLGITTLDGIPVTPVGIVASGQDAGAGSTLSFSYTVR